MRRVLAVGVGVAALAVAGSEASARHQATHAPLLLANQGTRLDYRIKLGLYPAFIGNWGSSRCPATYAIDWGDGTITRGTYRDRGGDYRSYPTIGHAYRRPGRYLLVIRDTLTGSAATYCTVGPRARRYRTVVRTTPISCSREAGSELCRGGKSRVTYEDPATAAGARAKPWRIFTVNLIWNDSAKYTLPGETGGNCTMTATATGRASTFFVATHPFPKTWIGIVSPVRFGMDKTTFRSGARYTGARVPASVTLVLGKLVCEQPEPDHGCSGTYRAKVDLIPSWGGDVTKNTLRMMWNFDANELPTPAPTRTCVAWDPSREIFESLFTGSAAPLTRPQMLQRTAFVTSRRTIIGLTYGPLTQQARASFRRVSG